MKVSKTKVAIVLMIGTLLVATGCSKNRICHNSSSPAASSSQVRWSPSSNEDLTPMTISLAAGDNNSLWDDMQSEVGKLITEKTGISIKGAIPGGRQ